MSHDPARAHEQVNAEIARIEPVADATRDDAAGHDGEAAGYDETAGGGDEAPPEAAGIDEILDSRPPAETPAQPLIVEPPAPVEQAIEHPAAQAGAEAESQAEAEAESVAESESEAEAEAEPEPDSAPPRPEWNTGVAAASQPVEGEQDSAGGVFRGLRRRRGGAAAGDGGELPRTRVRDLPLDARLRIWLLRVLKMVVVGIVLGFVVRSWEAGLTLAILAGIADTLYQSRRVGSMVPGAAPVDRAQRRAQRRTQRQLAQMERGGYQAVHRRPIPGSVEVIDHLVVGPTGVYAIDSEKWDKELPIRTRNGVQLWLGPESKKVRLEHARWEAQQASERLSAVLGREIRVRPALAIYGPRVPWDVAPIRDVDVFSGDRLKKYLRRRARTKNLPVLADQEIQQILKAAQEVLPLDWRHAPTPVG